MELGLETPELDKQSEVIKSGESRTLTDFYDWLGEHGYFIAKYVRFEDRVHEQLAPISQSPEQLFADFFGIDLDKIEEERQAIVKALRNDS